jgi:hypothetical protein
MGMSPEARLGQLRTAVEKHFDFLSRNWVPADETTATVKREFTDIVMSVGGATIIDNLVAAVQQVGIIKDRNREILYPEFLLETYNLHIAAQEHTIPINKRTPEQILRDLKPGAARKLAEITFAGHHKKIDLIKGCADTTYNFVHGKLVVTAVTMGKYF